jgi:hypothetical protein
MISFSNAKKILNKNGNKYSDDQIMAIIEYFYKLAAINLDYIKTKKQIR